MSEAFTPTAEWQSVDPDMPLPPGLDIHSNFNGKRMVRIHQDAPKENDAVFIPLNTLDTEQVPPSLRDLSQWVCWKRETRDGKPTKVPYQTNGRKAESNNPATWSTLADVIKVAHKFDGIGIMFANGLVGFDADHAFDEHGQLNPQVAEIVNILDSYTEISPSGDGIHVLCFGLLPEGRRKLNGFELYSTGRYFTFTGKHIEGTPRDVERRGAQIAEVHQRFFGGDTAQETQMGTPREVQLSDDEILHWARKDKKTGAKFSALWDGDSGDYPSHSEADLALCSHLAYLSGDAVQVDRLFRQSRLYRPKWDTPHFGDGTTYGQSTIAKALNGKARSASPQAVNGGAGEGRDEKKSQGTLLTEIAKREHSFFHDASGTPYAIVTVNGSAEVVPLRTTEYRALLAARFSELYQTTPGTRGVEEAIRVLTKVAIYDALEREVFTRVGRIGEIIVLDLCNPKREYVVITAEDWQIVPVCPLLFRHARGMQALPTPIRGGNLNDLGKVVNMSGPSLRLMLAWLAFTLNPGGPYPILSLRAEQGGGKSNATRFLKSLIDSSHTPPRSEPRDIRDLMIATRSNWIVAFDNMSNIPDWLSDGLCRLATGGGFGTRQLYEDDTETTFVAKRPIVLNSIGDASTRGDFLSRALILDLPAISDERRLDEKEINATFEAIRPALLGALLDTAVRGLARVQQTKLARLPRMADFARWSTAIEQELGFTTGGFMLDYEGGQAEASTIATDSSLTAKVLCDWLDSKPAQWLPAERWTADGWTGKTGELYHELHHYAETYGAKATAMNLPKTPGWLSNELRRLAPALRNEKIDVRFSKHGKSGTTIEIVMIT